MRELRSMPLLNYNTNSSTTQPPLPRTKTREREIQPPLDPLKRPTEQPGLLGTGPEQPGLPRTSVTTSDQPALIATSQTLATSTHLYQGSPTASQERPTEQPGLPGTGPEQPGLPRTRATTPGDSARADCDRSDDHRDPAGAGSDLGEF